jgi:FAD/FMN-containing dehydrogenase
VDGELLTPDAPGYEAVRRPWAGRFHHVRPAAIARCASAGDVAAALEAARTSGMPLAVRAGGHCFAGRSSTTGLLVDVSPMDTVRVHGDRVTTGGGALLGPVYDALDAHGLAIAAGCGPTVGIAGLVLGGGLGILGRRHGLTSDQVVAAEVVMADGRIIACDGEREPELFWALRGAGGCRVGVVTSLTLRTVPAPVTTTLHARWTWADGPAVLDAWQRWAPDGPHELAASLLVTAGPDPSAPPEMHVFGAFLGGRAEAASLLGALAAPPPTEADLRELPFRDAKRRLAEHGPGDEAPQDAHTWARSEFVRGTLPADARVALLEHLASGRVPGERRGLDLTPWGGAYNRVPEQATAFAHRAERFLVKHEVTVDAGAGDDARAWLDRSWDIVHPWGSGRAYPNFPDPALDDHAAAYHGANVERLRRAEAAYDPDGLFR